MAKGDGIENKGHTKGRQLGIDGPKVGVLSGGTGAGKGKKGTDMKAMGRGLAKIKAQKGK